MDIHALPYRLRTKRQKKRAQKTDFDKQLLALHRLEDALWKARASLPPVPLDEPYQRGWKRSFILREDVKRSATAAFYETLLPKINTTQFSADKLFRTKTKRKGRRAYEARQQELRSFTEDEWRHPRLKLTDNEQHHFHLELSLNDKQQAWRIRYVFNEPWRYVLQVKPRMITHRRAADEVLEQQLGQLRNHIERHGLRPRQTRLLGSSYRYWKRYADEKDKYRNNFKNTPLHALVGHCSEANIQK